MIIAAIVRPKGNGYLFSETPFFVQTRPYGQPGTSSIVKRENPANDQRNQVGGFFWYNGAQVKSMMLILISRYTMPYRSQDSTTPNIIRVIHQVKPPLQNAIHTSFHPHTKLLPVKHQAQFLTSKNAGTVKIA